MIKVVTETKKLIAELGVHSAVGMYCSSLPGWLQLSELPQVSSWYHSVFDLTPFSQSSASKLEPQPDAMRFLSFPKTSEQNPLLLAQVAVSSAQFWPRLQTLHEDPAVNCVVSISWNLTNWSSVRFQMVQNGSKTLWLVQRIHFTSLEPFLEDTFGNPSWFWTFIVLHIAHFCTTLISNQLTRIKWI